MGVNASELIDKIYNASGVNLKAVAKRYKTKALVGGAIAGTAALTMPSEAKGKLKDALTRNHKVYPEYDSLGTMTGRMELSGAVGNIAGAAAGAIIGGKQYDKKLLESKAVRGTLEKIMTKGVKGTEERVPSFLGTQLKAHALHKAEKEAKKPSLIVKPLMERASKRFGEAGPRMAAGALAGGVIGGEAVSAPFNAKQISNDYHSGLKRYNGNRLQAGVSATSPYTFNLGLYGADKMAKK